MAEELTKVPAKVEAIAKAFAAECGEQGPAFSERDLVDAQLLFSECRKLRPDFTARQLSGFMARRGFRRVVARGRRWHFVVQGQELPDFHQRVNGPL